MIVKQIPLEQLWLNGQVLDYKRTGHLLFLEVAQLFSEETPKIVIAYKGEDLEWVEANEIRRIWDHELKDHIGSLAIEEEKEKGLGINDFEDEYYYLVSTWQNGDDKLLLFEMYH